MRDRHNKSRGSIGLLDKLFFRQPHVCPWWLAYSFDNPIRWLFHNPADLFGRFVEAGQTAVDIGCGYGYFSIGLARLVGPEGKVIALDVQPRMIRHAQRLGLDARIDFRVCAPDRLGVSTPVDFVLAFWVMHEVMDRKRLLLEVRSFLKPRGMLLIGEPKGHVSQAMFAETHELARQLGCQVTEGPDIRFSRSVVCSLTEEDQ